jgi:hypothetical protein
VRLGKRTGILMIAAVLAAAPPARAERALPPTHAAVLDSLAARVAGDLLRGQDLPADRTVYVEEPVPGDTLGVFAQQIVQALSGRGTPVRIAGPRGPAETAGPAPGNADGDLRLKARVQSTGLSYVRTIRGFLGRAKAYERFGYLHASATLLDGGSGTVLWARTASAESRDRVSRGDLAYVSAGSARLDPAIPGGRGFRLLEPLIVVGVVAGLVVLFYSNRN